MVVVTVLANARLKCGSGLGDFLMLASAYNGCRAASSRTILTLYVTSPVPIESKDWKAFHWNRVWESARIQYAY